MRFITAPVASALSADSMADLSAFWASRQCFDLSASLAAIPAVMDSGADASKNSAAADLSWLSERLGTAGD